MNARWIEIPLAHGVFDRWCAVSDDDEIVGDVVGSDQEWTANVSIAGVVGSGKCGRFISKESAQKSVERWLTPMYTFPVASANTSWAYKA